jgi:protease IV
MVYLADTRQNPNPPYETRPPQRKKSRWWLIFLIVFSVLCAGFFILIGSFYFLFKSSLEPKTVTVKPRSVIQLKVSGELAEYVTAKPLAIFGQDGRASVSFLDVLTAVRRAKSDNNITGLYYRSGGLDMGFAKATELRDALLDFKKTGKFIYAYIEAGGELDYYFASTADSIFMPTEGMVELNGFGVSQIFWKGTLEKLGVEPFVTQFEEYKSAAETYSSKGFSSYSRQELRVLIDERFRNYVNAVAQSRNLDPAVVQRAMNRGIYSADSAMACKFIDGIRSELAVKQLFDPEEARRDSIKSREHKTRMITLSQYVRSYAQASPDNVVRDKEIAIVYGSGMMVPGRADGGGPFGDAILASESFIMDLHRAADEKQVKAIIIRIDSPGGAVIAADAIWAEIQKIKKEKPIYASMSDVAASGGYYMAMACDTIIAHPATITGSIGVISIIPNISGTLNKIGATSDTVATSPAALFLNTLMPFSERDKQTFYQISEPMYKRFVQRVADSRHKTFAQARQVARGRVWSGESALTIGLVDTLGGLQTALQVAKRRLGVTPQQRVRLRIYPEPRDPLQSLFNLLQESEPQDNLSRVLSKMDLSWLALQNSRIRKQVQYLLLLSYYSSMNKMLVALPFLPMID